MKLPEDVRAKLQKLKALAERGVGGEKRAAQAQYDRLLAEFGLTQQDVFPQPRVYDTYSIKNQHEETLLVQLWAMVTQTSGVANYRKESGRALWFEATAEQHVQLKAEFARHRKGLAKHLEEATRAYCLAHELAGPPSGRPSAMTAEEVARLHRAMASVAVLGEPERPALGVGRQALGGGQ
ncbi:hypothetical protein GO986_16350 [Deinococcus sp. HMF7620]|uniref:DUF2786 domain-containing protein n=1 Tax=Deinococcus arboris TaxID=2682977 RepID=A0A7C9LML9_9DEIO|nr:hypothetical protein [Deinococcus arboris]MVN88318.1 hypothetical protein [Deinococcus arboris]